MIAIHLELQVSGIQISRHSIVIKIVATATTHAQIVKLPSMKTVTFVKLFKYKIICHQDFSMHLSWEQI